MTALGLLILAGGLLAASGMPGLLLPWRSAWGPRIATLGTLLAAVVGLAGAARLLSGAPAQVSIVGAVVSGVRPTLGADALSAFFAVPVFVVGALGSVYGLRYRPPAEQPRNGRRLRSCYGLLLGSMVFVLLARDGASFLVAWEVMALCGYFLVATDSHRREVRSAGWLYLVYSHAGTLAIAGFFAVLARASGDFALRALGPGEIGRGVAFVAFALACAGFGIKAGAMPLHSWLPPAHAAAPSHISAVMSGVLLKMGVYGLARATAVLPAGPAWWGAALLVVGAVSAVLALALALAQRDLKRLLAYSSIENVGVILVGLGLALVGRSTGRGEWVLLGMAGCLFHVWNHALFKSLLFLGAGAVVDATGSRDIERMGGLARRMPVTSTLFLAGAIAICGLPPFNGFASELLLYLGSARAAISPGAAWVALAAPALAATGALAIACFVKVAGIVFLGTPRSSAAAGAREAPAAMLGAMGALAALCALLGIAPILVAPALEVAASAWAGPPIAGPALVALVPFGWVSAAAVGSLAVGGLLLLALRPRWRRGRERQPELPTWDCGYAATSPRLQYTGSSFAEIVTARFAWALRPHGRRPFVAGVFPRPTGFHIHADDTVLVHLVRPRVERLRRFAIRLRAYQAGQIQDYVLYIVVALALLLLFDLWSGSRIGTRLGRLIDELWRGRP
jgi:hydrogenase-4 component B